MFEVILRPCRKGGCSVNDWQSFKENRDDQELDVILQVENDEQHRAREICFAASI